jgi:hypothetical protein
MKAFKIIVVLILLVGVYLLLEKDTTTAPVPPPTTDAVQEIPTPQTDRMPSKYVCVGEYCDGSMDDDNPASRTVLQIPLIKDGGSVGCGVGIFFAPHAVPKTTRVLDATYRLLFDLKATPEIAADGFRNTVGAYTKLHYQSVSIKDGTAKLMLTGTMYGPGHCAEPELREQINQAAFQFGSVKKIEVYLNGTLFDWCTTSDADPSESRCDTTPRYWIDTRKTVQF